MTPNWEIVPFRARVRVVRACGRAGEAKQRVGEASRFCRWGWRREDFLLDSSSPSPSCNGTQDHLPLVLKGEAAPDPASRYMG